MISPQPLLFTLTPDDTHRLANLCGQFNEHIHQIEKTLGIDIRQRGNQFSLFGSKEKSCRAQMVILELYDDTHDTQLTLKEVQLSLQTTGKQSSMKEPSMKKSSIKKPSIKSEIPIKNKTSQVKTNVASMPSTQTKRSHVKPRGRNQQLYVGSIEQHDVNFGIGPAGTGKTYLAVACAVDALLNDKVERILLVRPAVEAGEKLGFLPGDLAQKIDPYLRPLYDALYEMMGFETIARLIEKQVIEIAPLAYMRGRTLNNSFIILDESQNTTVAQMKMFLTRIGFGSTAVITGDMTQVDLPRGTESGLAHAANVLKNVKDIGFTHFTSKDVVRHPLVQQIVDAYEDYENLHP